MKGIPSFIATIGLFSIVGIILASLPLLSLIFNIDPLFLFLLGIMLVIAFFTLPTMLRGSSNAKH